LGHADSERLADVLAVRELTARYGYAIDHGDAEGFADVFTEDGAFVVRGAGEPVVHAGREALTKMATRPPQQQVHASTDAIVEIDGDTATQACIGLYFPKPANPGEPSVPRVTRYDDELVRTPEGWKFRRRTVTPWF
jgi:uncharacterized protein (TIGR02246 family)